MRTFTKLEVERAEARLGREQQVRSLAQERARQPTHDALCADPSACDAAALPKERWWAWGFVVPTIDELQETPAFEREVQRYMRDLGISWAHAALRLRLFDEELGADEHAADALWEMWTEGYLDLDDLRSVITYVWSLTDDPTYNLGCDRWRHLFHLAGYVHDGVVAEPPGEPIQLWRGATYGDERGWSWTADRTIAERFAEKHSEGRVWTALVEPLRLLARLDLDHEAEYVVDTRCLAVVRDVER